jgi:prepilin-type N-terminal cleavage/methylation domain-containing protein
MGKRIPPTWGAHALRVLAIAPSRSRTFPGKHVLAGRQNQHARARALPGKDRAFTLIELLVVIAIIIILAGLLYPAYNAVQSQAKRTQAKNDLTQIVNAVNAYYTEYGKYPIAASTDAAGRFGPTAQTNTNNVLFNELRATAAATQNPRQIVFISPPYAKDQNNPRSGIRTADNQWYDPWGTGYYIWIDGNYDNQIANPYTADTGAGPGTLNIGVIAWSLGKDQAGATAAASGDKNTGVYDDDVISWQ